MADKEVTTKLILSGEPGGLIAAMNKCDAALAGTKKQTDLLAEAGQMLGGALVGIGIVALAKQALDAGLQMEKLAKLFTAAAGSADLGAREMEYARQVADKMGLSFLDTAESYGKFLAASRNTTLEGEKGRKVFESVSGASVALGLSLDETKGIFNALQQMMSKGKVQAEELRGQLGERLPGAFKMAADAMGVTTAELDKMMADGKLLADDLLPKLAVQLDKTYGKAAQEGARGATAEINRLNTAIFETKGAAGAALIPVFTDIVKAMKPALGLLQEFIGGIQILAVKAAAIPDRIGAAWDVVKSGKGIFSTEGLALYASKKAQITAAEDEAIADILKKFSRTGNDYNAAELSRQSAINPTKPLPTKKPTDDSAAWQSAADKHISYLETFEARKVAIARTARDKEQFDNEQAYTTGLVALGDYLKNKRTALEAELDAEKAAAEKNLAARQADLTGKTKAGGYSAKEANEYEDALKKVEQATIALINVESKRSLGLAKNTAESQKAIDDKQLDEAKAEFDHQESLVQMAANASDRRLALLGREDEALVLYHDTERQRIISQTQWKLENITMEENERRRLTEQTNAALVNLDRETAQRRAQNWWDNAQQYIGFSQNMATVAGQLLIAESGQKEALGKKMLAMSIRFGTQTLQAYMMNKAKEHVLNAFAAGSKTTLEATAATANLTILGTQATAWAAFYAAQSLNPFGGQAFIPAATAMSAVAGGVVPTALAGVVTVGATSVAAESAMAAAWGVGAITVGAAGEVAAGSIEGGTTSGASYGTSPSSGTFVTQPVSTASTSPAITVVMNFDGTTLVDQDKLNRWNEDVLIPSLRELQTRGVTV